MGILVGRKGDVVEDIATIARCAGRDGEGCRYKTGVQPLIQIQDYVDLSETSSRN